MKIKRNTKCGHLGENDLFGAVAWPEEAPGEVLAHVESCPSCKEEVEALGGGLARLGDMAQRSVPALKRRIILPPEPVRQGHAFFGGGLKVALGFALSVAIAVSGVFTYNSFTKSQIEPARIEYAENTPLFFEEPQAFGQNVLPSDYLDMAGETVDQDEELFGEVSEDDDFVSFASPA